ncbi:hypothetical protein RND81_02G232600 [Saponaria officinalis]|uniref:Uncharacterized protein n=1 Tax=Saponaria officinalis TaxID=3572 RepID=A0AAW1MP58_SAPOF
MTNLVFPLCWESTGDQWWYATPIDWAAANSVCDLPRAPQCEFRAQVARSLLLDCEAKSGNGEQKNTLIRAGYGGWLLYTATSAGDVEFVKDLVERDPLVVFGKGEYGITDILYSAARSGNSEVFRVLLEYAMDVNKGARAVAVHAAARGGNLEILKELLLNCSDVSGFRDCLGYTLLHSAAGKGQIEVVKDLIKAYDIIGMTDSHGNTALHVAAYKGHSSVVEALILASPKLATSRNDDGDTFLHMTVAGFRSPGFHRIEQQIELVKTLANNKLITSEYVVNITNNDGRTALHVAVAMNIHCNVVDILMGFPSLNLYIRDIDGFTPLNLLKRRPVGHTGIQGIGTSPGTSFRFRDSDLLSCTGNGNESDFSCEPSSSRFSSCSSEQIITHFDSGMSKKRDFTKSASKRFKFRLQWPMRVDRSSLMQGIIQAPYSPSTPYFESSLSSPTLAHDVKGDIGAGRVERRPRFFSGPLSGERLAKMDNKHRRVSSFSKSLMNQYFYFGAQGLAVEVEDSVSYKRKNRSCRRLVF